MADPIFKWLTAALPQDALAPPEPAFQWLTLVGPSASYPRWTASGDDKVQVTISEIPEEQVVKDSYVYLEDTRIGTYVGPQRKITAAVKRITLKAEAY